MCVSIYRQTHIVYDVCGCVFACVRACVCSCVCVCVGVVQKNKKEVKRWEAYVSVTCTWLPECLYMLGLPIAICKDSLVTYSVCTTGRTFSNFQLQLTARSFTAARLRVQLDVHACVPMVQWRYGMQEGSPIPRGC